MVDLYDNVGTVQNSHSTKIGFWRKILFTKGDSLIHVSKILRTLFGIIVSTTGSVLLDTSDWKALGGHAGVGMPNAEPVVPIWSNEHLGLVDGTAPKLLRTGHARVVDSRAVRVTREKFNDLLGPVEIAPAVNPLQVAPKDVLPIPSAVHTPTPIAVAA